MIECESCLEEYQEGHLELHRQTCKVRLAFRCCICNEDYVSREGLWNHLDLHEIPHESKELHCQEMKAKHKLHQCAQCNDQRGYSESSYQTHDHDFHYNNQAQDRMAASDLNDLVEPPASIDAEDLASHDAKMKESLGNHSNEAIEDHHVAKDSKHPKTTISTSRKSSKSKGKVLKSECPQCFMKFKRLKLHLASCGGTKHACEFCNRKFRILSRLYRHRKNIHHVDRFPQNANVEEVIHVEAQNSSEELDTTLEITYCIICGTFFNSAEDLEQHKLTCFTHSKEPDNFQFAEIKVEETKLQDPDFQVSYEVPGRSTATTLQPHKNLSKHVQSEATGFENGIKIKEECLENEEKIYTKPQETTKSSEQRFECQVCGQFFGNRHVLRYHKIVSHREPQYECTICRKIFHFARDLNFHKKGCLDLRCHKCNIKFQQRGQLKRHNMHEHLHDMESNNERPTPSRKRCKSSVHNEKGNLRRQEFDSREKLNQHKNNKVHRKQRVISRHEAEEHIGSSENHIDKSKEADGHTAEINWKVQRWMTRKEVRMPNLQLKVHIVGSRKATVECWHCLKPVPISRYTAENGSLHWKVSTFTRHVGCHMVT